MHGDNKFYLEDSCILKNVLLTMVNEKTRRMEYLIYILTVGLLQQLLLFRIMNTLAKEVANIKKRLTKNGPWAVFFISSCGLNNSNKRNFPY